MNKESIKKHSRHIYQEVKKILRFEEATNKKYIYAQRIIDSLSNMAFINKCNRVKQQE